MSSSPQYSPVNGHTSPLDGDNAPTPRPNDLSDSELSEVHEQLPYNHSPSPSQSPDDLSHQPDFQPSDAESSQSSDHDVSDDGDFNTHESPASVASHAAENGRPASSHGSSSDSSSRRPPKRKFDEEEYMQANPELYGLRRSARDVQRRKLVESSDEDDSDIIAPSRRTAKRRRAERSVTSSKRPTPARQTPVDDEDSDDYGSKSKKRSRRRYPESQLGAPFVEKQRWSSRRAAQVVNGAYAESEFDNEEDAEDAGGAFTATVVVNSGPYIDKVVKHLVSDSLDMEEGTSREDLKYYIKWTGKSHIHDTWETLSSLRDMSSGGLKKVENYFRRTVQQEKDVRFDRSIDPDLKEQFFLDRERDREALDDFTKIERVVSHRSDESGADEYFVKWLGLTYDECTWEEASLVKDLSQEKIDQYLARSSRSWKSDASEARMAARKPMGLPPSQMKQPTYVTGGELRPFQIQGLYFLCHNWTRGRNVILADEMGLGKTVQTVSFLSWLKNDRRQEGPFLVVAPLSVIPAWSDTFNFWAPDMNYVVYTGPEAARKIIRENEWFIDGNPRKHKFHVLLTTFDFVNVDAEYFQTLNWQALAVDEAHRLKNREGKIYQKLEACNAPCKLLITGTPIQNNLSELSALLDFLNPGQVTIDENLEAVQNLPPQEAEKKLKELHSAIQPYILRRTKETVEKDLPPKTEKILRVELADVQLEYYKNILTRNYAELTKANGGRPQSLLNIMMELKKVSNHPYMMPGVEERVLAGSMRREDRLRGLVSSSGKMMLLDQLLNKLKRDNHRVLIFSQMVTMLEILGEYLTLSSYQYQRLDGTIPAGPRRLAIDHFNADESQDFCFLLSTRAGGLGINLMTADTVILFDSDWNPQADLQAMARAHRIGQKRPVNVYRLVSKETVEEEILERARNKLLLEYLTIQAGVTDSEGKNKLDSELKKKGLMTDEVKSADDIQYVLKMRSQKMFSLEGNQERLEQLDIDSILENAEVTKTNVAGDKLNLSTGGMDFLQEYTDVRVEDLARDWDDIIPAEKVAELKAAEEAREHEEYLRRAAEESAPRRAALKGSMKDHRHQHHDGDDRAERLAKKRERELAKQEALDEQRAIQTDPKRALSERETRNLIRAFFRYGSMETRYDEIAQDARLSDRDHDFIMAIVNDFVSACQRAVDDNNGRLRQEEAETGKPLTKKDKKAVLVNFGEVRKINAETALERPPQLRLLRDIIKREKDWRAFRIPDATKAPSYTCSWGSQEDGMLLVGINKHGFGAWAQIRDDPELNMQDKFFLDEHKVEKKESRSKEDIKSPGAVHLVRRADYLLSVMESKFSNNPTAQKAVENHHRNNKKALLNGHGRGNSISASPAPHMGRSFSDRGDDRDRHRARHHSDHHRHRDRVDSSSSRHDKRKRERDEDERPHTKARRVERHPSNKLHHHATSSKNVLGEAEDSMSRLKKRRHDAMANLKRLRHTDEEALKKSNDDYDLMWLLMRPIHPSIEKILQTKDMRNDRDSKDELKKRGAIMKEELQNIGDFIEDMYHNLTDSIPIPKFERLMVRFWVFFADIWPFVNPQNPIEGETLEEKYMQCRTAKQRDSSKPARPHGIPKHYWKSHRQDNPDGLPPLHPRKS
ncbi:hypothetical protein MKZ38_007101 [Zalerion maritima]|uniref:Uncharacterized protein n=1 Tax=Zalerion maritima TaxID=339359 RepID=A0AAD5RIC0_9PEZI|nr:hypothetical protein MKZ38_007101 [Zalerion maritima]